MARLNNPWDNDRLKSVRARQADPIVQYILTAKTTQLSAAELDEQAAVAVRRAARFADDPVWGELYGMWLAQSFRKVCLRGSGGQFDRAVAELDCEVYGEVAVLPPRRKSERERILEQMQNLAYVKNPEPLPAWAEPAADLTLVVNGDLGMTHGKMIAQVGHGALRPAWPAGRVDDPNATVAVCQAGAAELARICEEHDVWVVQDAGHTEIEPGSETVFVISRPGGGA
jgi:hypothetical protein